MRGCSLWEGEGAHVAGQAASIRQMQRRSGPHLQAQPLQQPLAGAVAHLHIQQPAAQRVAIQQPGCSGCHHVSVAAVLRTRWLQQHQCRYRRYSRATSADSYHPIDIAELGNQVVQLSMAGAGGQARDCKCWT